MTTSTPTTTTPPSARDPRMTELGPLVEVAAQILEILPQREPFRFLDRILEVSENHIVGQYRFDPALDFYRGHFPQKPLTPGVILIETMAQTSVVGFGIYQMLLDQRRDPKIDMSRFVSLFSECQAEFLKPVPPGTVVTVTGEKIYWRRKKLRASATMRLPDGEICATATLSGMGVQL